jgi:hypothetical protein
MTVTAPQADVYSGPATTYYPTSRLRGGDRVIVLGESRKQAGWVEILPPSGSFSWIDARYVKLIPGVERIGIVDTGDPRGTVPIRPGSNTVNTDPNVEIARVATGTQVVLLDRATPGNGTSWYPIAPVATEVRYLPSDAVRPGGGTYASNGYNQYPYGTYPAGYSPNTPSYGSPTANPLNVQQLSQQADQALAAGNTTRAYQLYAEALGQTQDPQWRQYLQSQISRIQPNSSWQPTGGAPTSTVPTYPTGTAAPFAPTGATAGVATAGPATVGQKTWSQWGVLRPTSITHEGQPMYLLESRDTQQPLIYVTSRSGTSLRELVGQTVALYGTIGYRDDAYIRMQYMVAEQVATPPTTAQR